MEIGAVELEIAGIAKFRIEAGRVSILKSSLSDNVLAGFVSNAEMAINNIDHRHMTTRELVPKFLRELFLTEGDLVGDPIHKGDIIEPLYEFGFND